MGIVQFVKKLWDDPAPMREAASAQSGGDESGWRRLTGDGFGQLNERDLQPMEQDRMQKLAEYLW